MKPGTRVRVKENSSIAYNLRGKWGVVVSLEDYAKYYSVRPPFKYSVAPYVIVKMETYTHQSDYRILIGDNLETEEYLNSPLMKALL